METLLGSFYEFAVEYARRVALWLSSGDPSSPLVSLFAEDDIAFLAFLLGLSILLLIVALLAEAVFSIKKRISYRDVDSTSNLLWLDRPGGKYMEVRGPWVYFVDSRIHHSYDKSGSGKWMLFFSDCDYADSICSTAVLHDVVQICKRSVDDVVRQKGSGVICFYIDGRDAESHRRVLSFMIHNNLVRRTKEGRLYNISFKFDQQTVSREYGKDFVAEIKLSDFVDLNTGDFIA